MITSTTFTPSGPRAHPEERPEAPSRTPPATPAIFRNSLRVSVLFSSFPPGVFQAEQIGDTRGEQGQPEDVVRAAQAGVAEKDDRHHQRARQLEKQHRLPRKEA